MGFFERWIKIMNYEQALIAARNGNAVIFYGAGFSYGLKSASGATLPTARKLAEILCQEIGINKTEDLRVASKKYLKQKSPDDLIKLLKDYFLISDVADYYNAITSVPWRSIYTTNYDNTFEVSALKTGIRFESMDLENNPRDFAGAKRIIHINGFINSVRPDNLNTSFKLTNTSYLTEQFRNSSWSEVFKRDIGSAHAIFFLGYSLYDIDIQEILFADQQLKEKTFFIEKDSITDDEIEDLGLNEFGTIKKIGITGFSTDLNKVDPLAINSDEELIVTSFERMSLSQNSSNINDSEVISLLLRGDLKETLLYNDLLSKMEKYNIVREGLSHALEGLKRKENLIIYGGLANGKTIFSKHISMNLYNEGYSVFELKDDFIKEYAYKEIEIILRKNPKTLFVIENYTDNLDVVSHINTSRSPEAKILLISRTHEHERTESELFYSKKIIDIQQTFEIHLDELTPKDIDKVIIFFDTYGLWGREISLQYWTKERILKI